MPGLTFDPKVGDRYGQQTVIEAGLRMPQTPQQIELDKKGDPAVLVRCDCGNERLVRLKNLMNSQKPTKKCRSCRSKQQGALATRYSPEVVTFLRRVRQTAPGREVKLRDLREALGLSA